MLVLRLPIKVLLCMLRWHAVRLSRRRSGRQVCCPVRYSCRLLPSSRNVRWRRQRRRCGGRRLLLPALHRRWLLHHGCCWRCLECRKRRVACRGGSRRLVALLRWRRLPFLIRLLSIIGLHSLLPQVDADHVAPRGCTTCRPAAAGTGGLLHAGVVTITRRLPLILATLHTQRGGWQEKGWRECGAAAMAAAAGGEAKTLQSC